MFDAGSGGGYFDQTSNFESPGGTDKKKDGPNRNQVVYPVVIGMLNACTSDEFTIWGEPVHIVKIVGIVRKIEVLSTKVTYEIEDNTGKIDAVFWLEQEQNDESNLPVDKERIYVEVFGTIRTQDNVKLIMILKIQPISSMNIITTHLLEVIHVRYQMEQLYRNQGSISHTNPGKDLSNSMMFTNYDTTNMNMNPIQSKIYVMIRNCELPVGLDTAHILENFPKHQHTEAEKAIRFLIDEGHIFSTINSDHFKATDV